MPAPKPIAKHLQDGTYRADRHARRRRIEVVGGELKPPLTLDRALRPLWRKVVGTLDKGWTCSADVWLLVGLVEALHFQSEAARSLVGIGTVVKTVNGDIHRSPYFLVWSQSVEKVRSLSAKLGLSPIDRARIEAIAAGGEDIDTGLSLAEILFADVLEGQDAD